MGMMEILLFGFLLIFTLLIVLVSMIAGGYMIYYSQKQTKASPDILSEKNISEIDESGITQGVILVMQHNPSQWMLNNIRPKIEINTRSYEAKWGVNEIDLDPGDYDLECFFPYMGNKKSCKAAIHFQLKDDDVLKMKYETPIVVFSNGTIKILENE
mgnify:CR=1 FL=1